MYTPVNPRFTIYKWGVRGSSLHGHVFVMPTITFDSRIFLHCSFVSHTALYSSYNVAVFSVNTNVSISVSVSFPCGMNIGNSRKINCSGI